MDLCEKNILICDKMFSVSKSVNLVNMVFLPSENIIIVINSKFSFTAVPVCSRRVVLWRLEETWVLTVAREKAQSRAYYSWQAGHLGGAV